jgi:mono/diheme cytochrome c family protein
MTNRFAFSSSKQRQPERAGLGRPSIVVGVTFFLLATPLRAADEGPVDLGHRLIVENCSGCHSVEKTGDSPLAKAPPFRDLHNRYHVEDLSEALAEGIVTGHATMPEFAFKSDEVGAIIAYLKTLEQ